MSCLRSTDVGRSHQAALVPRAGVIHTGPNNSAWYALQDIDDIRGGKADWYKHEFEHQAGDEVTLQVIHGSTTLLERACTVDQRAVDLTHAEMITYPAGGRDTFEADTPLPPGPSVHCACGFREYGDQRNANQCSP